MIPGYIFIKTVASFFIYRINFSISLFIVNSVAFVNLFYQRNLTIKVEDKEGSAEVDPSYC